MKGHIQMEDLSANINHGELQLNFCAYPDLYMTQNIGSNLSQYIYVGSLNPLEVSEP